MRKLPEGAPDGVYWLDTKFYPLEYLDRQGEHRNPGKVRLEIHPAGTRALLDEALKMVEKHAAILEACGKNANAQECRALLAKATGEGT